MLNDTLRIRVLAEANLPSPPAVALRLVEMFQDERVSLGTLGDHIAKDPALAAKVLRVASSPVYHLGVEIRSLSQAVRVLGVRRVAALGLSFTLFRSLPRSGRGDFDYDRYWRRSIFTAMSARALARLRAPSLDEEAFLTGLLQDLGMLALAHTLGDEYGALTLEAGLEHASLAVLERQRLGTTHAELGAQLLERWGLPRLIVESVFLSHGRGDLGPSIVRVAPAAEAATAPELIRCAGLLADLFVRPEEPEHTYRVLEEIEDVLDLTEDESLQVLEEVGAAVPVMSDLFGTRLSDPASLAKITEAARDALLVLSLTTAPEIDAAERTRQKLEELARRGRLESVGGGIGPAEAQAAVEAEFTRARAAKVPSSLILCTVDRLGGLGAGEGEELERAVLLRISDALEDALRPVDVVARWAGGALAILLPGIASDLARTAAERLRTGVHALEIVLASGAVLHPTVSLGLATSDRFETAGELVGAAEQALRVARRSGGNRAVGRATILAPVRCGEGS